MDKKLMILPSRDIFVYLMPANPAEYHAIAKITLYLTPHDEKPQPA